jgi:hypothetical protein
VNSSERDSFFQILKSSHTGTWLVVLVILGSSVGFSQSLVQKARPKRQHIENDSYFKTSRMNSLSTKINKEENPWGLSFYASSGTDVSKQQPDRTYNQTLSTSAAYKLTKTQSIGLQMGVSYYAVDNNIPKEEGNPVWDDLSLSWSHDLGEINNLKLSHSVSTFAPTSYDSQFEGIKTGLSYSVGASHKFYFIYFNHGLSANYTQHTYDYSPTTNRKNSAWSNAYTFSVGAPYKINKDASIGISQNIANRSTFDNNYILITSTLLYGGYKIGKAKVSLNYLVGSYDENKTMRFFYVNEWEQKVTLGVSYEI